MEIELSITLTERFEADISAIFHELSDRLNHFIKGKTFGDDINKVKVGFIMVLSRPGYEHWHKPKKISYTDHRISKSRLTGEIIEINKQLSFELRLDENLIGSILNANKIEAQRLLMQEVLNYFCQIKTLPKKIKHFDKDLFIIDLKEFTGSLVE